MSEDNNRRIAKNTLYLYIRSGITMIVALYTSRVVLNALGVEDFGIWGVLGGVISMFGFINQSLSASIFRYITHAIGMDDQEQLNRTYNVSIIIHIGLAVVLFILCATVGQWFLAEKLVVPDAKRAVANTVFYIAILSSIISLLTVPFNSVIIAYERMNVFAYLTITDTIFKLLIAAVVYWVPENKLFWYAVMMLAITTVMLFFYCFYVHINFKNLHFQRVNDKRLYKSLLGFSGWSLLGNLAYVGYSQGLNLLLNIFFGPVVNAARSISLQIEQTVRTFVGNFQTAINPQIIKNYAQKEFAQMHSLMIRSSKFSIFLLFILVLPVLMETETILLLWLRQVPEYTVIFVRIMFSIIALEVLSNSIMIGVVATGNIKKYQIIVGTILLTIVPISYAVLRMGAPAESVFIVYLIVEIIAVVARLVIAHELIHLSIRQFLNKVVLKSFLVVVAGSAIPFMFYVILPQGIERFLAVSAIGFFTSTISIYLLGLDAREKRVMTEKIRQKLHL